MRRALDLGSVKLNGLVLDEWLCETVVSALMDGVGVQCSDSILLYHHGSRCIGCSHGRHGGCGSLHEAQFTVNKGYIYAQQWYTLQLGLSV